MIKKLDKRGTDKIISVYWFAILFIAAAAVSYMVISFYGKPYDIRELEAHALTNKAADCISQNGYLREDIFSENFKSNLIEMCDFNFDTEATFEGSQYYLGVDVYKNNAAVLSTSQGNKNLVSSCGIEKEIERERLATCIEREFYSLNSEKEILLVKVTSIVRKTEKNVKL